MKYWIQEIGYIEGSSDIDIVTAMRDISPSCSHQSIEEFMLGFKERQYQYNALFIDTTSVATFVATLQILKILMDKDEFDEHNNEKMRKNYNFFQ